MSECDSLWDFDAMKERQERQERLPPWSLAIRERVRRELRAKPMFVCFDPHLEHDVNQVQSQWTRVDPQPTVLGEERKARGTNVSHYCRKCRGLGTKRHHAMCPKRGAPWKFPDRSTWEGLAFPSDPHLEALIESRVERNVSPQPAGLLRALATGVLPTSEKQ